MDAGQETVADDDGRVAIGAALPGVRIHPLELDDEIGVQIEGVFVLVKYADREGVGWAYRTSASPNREELLGALTVHVRLLERELVSEWPAD